MTQAQVPSTPRNYITVHPFEGIEEKGFSVLIRSPGMDSKEIPMPAPHSRNEAAIQELYVRLKKIDLAIRSLEKLQRTRAKGPTMAVVRRILSGAA